jgi:hypothetical protein
MARVMPKGAQDPVFRPLLRKFQDNFKLLPTVFAISKFLHISVKLFTSLYHIGPCLGSEFLIWDNTCDILRLSEIVPDLHHSNAINIIEQIRDHLFANIPNLCV